MSREVGRGLEPPKPGRGPGARWRRPGPGGAGGLLALTALAHVLGCGPQDVPLRGVVLVTVDTLRADRLGLHGAGGGTSPSIDALGSDATVFDGAISTCPATAPAVASLLSGHHRAAHGVLRNTSVMPAQVETLAEILGRRGFRTLASVANPVLGPEYGFGQGFEHYGLPAALERAGPGMLGGAPVVEEARRLLDLAGDAPFFLWLHFMDPHGPYFPPARYRALFASRDHRWPGDRDLPIARGNYVLSMIPRYQAVGGELTPADYRARYAAEVRYVDDHVGAVVADLRRRGLLDRVLLVLTADHGESLGEHEYYFQHGWFAYDDCLRVPLLLRAPGRLPAGRRVAATVSLVDVAPTILDVLGVADGARMEGRSLMPVVRGEAGNRPAFAQTYQGNGLVALRLGRRKYIFTPPQPSAGTRPAPAGPLERSGHEELYDVALDPRETRDLAAAHPAATRRLRRRVERWLRTQAARAPATPASGGADDPMVEKQLRALGYLD